MIPVMSVTVAERRGGLRRPIRVVLTFVLAVSASGCGAVPPSAPEVVAARQSPPAAPTSSRPTQTEAPSASPPASPSPPPTASAARAVPSAALQAALTRFLRSTGTPGISATIRWPDGRTWTGTAGYADVARRIPVTPDTAFAVASMSKTFTAALILELVDEGSLGLDTPAARYLPDEHLDPRITIRMLLDHTSGLNDAFLNPRIDRALQSKPAARWTPQQALAYVRKPYFAPGDGWHYSNTNYLLLGLVAQAVTGRDLAVELHRRLMAPLGLDRTWVQASEATLAPLAHGYVVSEPKAKRTPRDLSDGTNVVPFTSVITALAGAGSIAATSGDLATWAADLYGGRVVSSAMLAAMTDDQQRTKAYIPGVLYGLGVQTYDIGPWTTLGHSGRLLGFRGVMRYVPATGISLALVTNQSRADVAPLAARLLAIVLPPAGTPAMARR
jgi:D-alanyl-D-alanine carboxypeptidase